MSPLFTVTVNELLERIKKDKVNSYIVVNTENQFIGLITKRDLSAHLISGKTNSIIADSSNRTSSRITVGEIMNQDIITVEEDITREEAIKIMNQHKVEKLPVIVNGNVKGLIIYKNLLEYEINKNVFSQCNYCICTGWM